MNNKKLRYFWGFNKAHQNWLNKMSASGYRLVKTGKLSYEFEKCKPYEYQYYVDFVGQKSYEKLEDYIMFLNDMGYNTFSKNINLNWNLGKVSLRPYGEGNGKLSASLGIHNSYGTYNKELLIVEKLNDGKPFELHTSNEDRYYMCRIRRNAALNLAVIMILFLGIFFIKEAAIDTGKIVFFILTLISIIPLCIFQYKLKQLKKEILS